MSAERCKTCNRRLGVKDDDSSEACIDCYVCEGCQRRLVWHVEDPPFKYRCWDCLAAAEHAMSDH